MRAVSGAGNLLVVLRTEPRVAPRFGHSATIRAKDGANLPPYLTPPRKRRDDEPVITPDIRMIEQQSKVHDSANNWITIHYVWMNRVWGFFDRVEVAHVNSRRYRQWLETYKMKDDIPPHIQFGGAIKSGTGDPTFYSRWAAYARETFC